LGWQLDKIGFILSPVKLAGRIFQILMIVFVVLFVIGIRWGLAPLPKTTVGVCLQPLYRSIGAKQPGADQRGIPLLGSCRTDQRSEASA
jgi:hypothetical protein